jgi:hypothetical protein
MATASVVVSPLLLDRLVPEDAEALEDNPVDVLVAGSTPSSVSVWPSEVPVSAACQPIWFLYFENRVHTSQICWAGKSIARRTLRCGIQSSNIRVDNREVFQVDDVGSDL